MLNVFKGYLKELFPLMIIISFKNENHDLVDNIYRYINQSKTFTLNIVLKHENLVILKLATNNFNLIEISLVY